MKRTPLKRKTPMRRGGKQETARKPRKPLPKQSLKAKARNAEYQAAKRTWRAGHDGRCEMRHVNEVAYPINLPLADRCKRAADHNPHHRALRGPNLCRIDTFMACCAEHHRWIHDNAKEARRLGYLI